MNGHYGRRFCITAACPAEVCQDARMSVQSPERLFSTFLQIAFVGSLIALAVLSWLPAVVMTRSTLGGHAEHFIAYLGITTVMGLAFQRRPRLAIQCALLIACAAILEMGQLYSPGRHASFQDFAFSSSGVLVGGLLLWLGRARLSSWLKIS
jgi:VanZ family protein